ncbi:MFS transporter [Streptomyces sp. NPDC014805]|uniref:MFS transporter n=1 Tax=Streptomyces sp. NPDC014805 TaxID=3364919 RepID=UPI00370253F9
MLLIALVDRIGSGLWASVSVLYFTYVTHLSVAQIGTLAAAAGAVGIAGSPLGGRLADRFPVTRILVTVQLLRAAASLALLTTDRFALLLLFSAVGSLGDRASSVLTKLYATRIAGPDRVRYQALHRTLANAGWALGGLAAAAALAQAAQRGIGPLAVTAAIATGPAGWTLFGAAIALTCALQHRLVRGRIEQTPLSVPSVTVSEH